MKDLLNKFVYTFFRRELELRRKIFHVLAIAGVCICVAMTIVSITQEMAVSIAINAGTGVISLALLIYSARGGKPGICYWSTVVFIFMVLFPSLFVFGGGYTGGMVFFFAFAVVYTVYMLDGWKMLAVTAFEIAYFSGFCVLAYLRPEFITPFASELDVLIDVIVGFVAVSASLGLTMFAQFRLYQRQQVELERARAEAEVASRAKSTFLANMSHEIRTPIHVIMSLNELIGEEAAAPQVREYSGKIRDAGEMLRGLVDNILDMSKIEAGKTELHIAPYRVSDLMRVLELTGETRCAAKGLKFSCEKSALPEFLTGDAEHIRRIVINLLSNAAKYTDSGSVALRAECELDENGAATLVFAVSDTGVGIEPEAMHTLFDAFVRAGDTRRVEGTGLGLAIAKELCDLMGGSIVVGSTVGEGSTFTVRLPQSVPAEGEIAASAAAPLARSFTAPQGRVLVVDDSADNLAVMRALLRRTELRVDTASSGEEALAMASAARYHVILMDYMMPELDGVETLLRLGELPGFDTPVVALTANAVAGTREALLGVGFAEYLTKPIPWGRLEALLLDLLPSELVNFVEAAAPSADAEAFIERFDPLAERHRIDLRAALGYFDGDPDELMRSTALLLKYSAADIEKFENCADGELVYLAHSLGGKAKNFGLLELSGEAERVEKLCRGGEIAEARLLLPHLLFLYKLGCEGLSALRGAIGEEN